MQTEHHIGIDGSDIDGLGSQGIILERPGYIVAEDEVLDVADTGFGAVSATLSESTTDGSGHSPEFWRQMTHVFSVDIQPEHALVQSELDRFYEAGTLRSTMSVQDVAEIVHDHIQPLLFERMVPAKTILQYEASLLLAHQTRSPSTEQSLVFVGEGTTWMNQYETGLMIGDSLDNLKMMQPGSTELIPFQSELYSTFNYTDLNRTVQNPVTGLNPVDYENAHTYVQPQDPAVQALVQDIFPQGIEGLSENEIVVAINNFMADDANFTYSREIRDEWSSVSEFIESRVGDCEDFANLQASLTISALESAGFSDAASRVSVYAGQLQGPTTALGHAFMTFQDSNGDQWVLDSTDQRPLTGLNPEFNQDRLYSHLEETYNFKLCLSYTGSSSTVHVSDLSALGFRTEAQWDLSALQTYMRSESQNLLNAHTSRITADSGFSSMSGTTMSGQGISMDGFLGDQQELQDLLNAVSGMGDEGGSAESAAADQGLADDFGTSTTEMLAATRVVENLTIPFSEMRPISNNTFSPTTNTSLTGLPPTVAGHPTGNFINEALHRGGHFNGGTTQRSFDALAIQDNPSYNGHTLTVNDGQVMYTDIRYFFTTADYASLQASLSPAQLESLRVEIMNHGHRAKSTDPIAMADYDQPVRLIYDPISSNPAARSYLQNLGSVPDFRHYPESSMSTALGNSLAVFTNEMSEFERHIQTGNLSKYVGQNQSGFVVYDFSRINRDFSRCLDALQYIMNIVEATMSYANMLNKMASNVSDSDVSSAKAKLYSKMSGAVKKAFSSSTDMNQQFITTFINAWDARNSATYKSYSTAIEKKFKGIEFMLGNAFFADEWSIQESQLNRVLEGEYFSICAQIREGFQRADTNLQNVHALFTEGDVTSTEEHGTRAWAEFSAQLEFDIANNVKKEIVLGATRTGVYVNALDYYFPWGRSPQYYDSSGNAYGVVPASVSNYFSNSSSSVYGNSNTYYIPMEIPTNVEASLVSSELDRTRGVISRAFDFNGAPGSNSFYVQQGGERYVDGTTAAATSITADNYRDTYAWAYFQRQARGYNRVFDNVQSEGLGIGVHSSLRQQHSFNDYSFSELSFDSRNSNNTRSSVVIAQLVANGFLEYNTFDASDFSVFENMGIVAHQNNEARKTGAEIFNRLKARGILTASGQLSSSVTRTQVITALVNFFSTTSATNDALSDQIYNFLNSREYALKKDTTPGRLTLPKAINPEHILTEHSTDTQYDLVFGTMRFSNTRNDETDKAIKREIMDAIRANYDRADEYFHNLDWDGQHVALRTNRGLLGDGTFFGGSGPPDEMFISNQISRSNDARIADMQEMQSDAMDDIGSASSNPSGTDQTAFRTSSVDGIEIEDSSDFFSAGTRASMENSIRTAALAADPSNTVESINALFSGLSDQEFFTTFGYTVSDFRGHSSYSGLSDITASAELLGMLSSRPTGLQNYINANFGDFSIAAGAVVTNSDGVAVNELAGYTARFYEPGGGFSSVQFKSPSELLLDSEGDGTSGATAAEAAGRLDIIAQDSANLLAEATALNTQAGNSATAAATSATAAQTAATASGTASAQAQANFSASESTGAAADRSTAATLLTQITALNTQITDAQTAAQAAAGTTPQDAATLAAANAQLAAAQTSLTNLETTLANLRTAAANTAEHARRAELYNRNAATASDFVTVNDGIPMGVISNYEIVSDPATGTSYVNELTPISDSTDEAMIELYSNSQRTDGNDQFQLAVGITDTATDGGQNNTYLAIDWAKFAATQKGIMSKTMAIRMYYLINSIVISAINSMASNLDPYAIGANGIESDSSIFDKRVGLVNLKYQNVMSKTNELTQRNNQWHQINERLNVTSDTGRRAAMMVEVWAGLVGSIMMTGSGLVAIAGAIICGVGSAAAIARSVIERDMWEDSVQLMSPNILQHIGGTGPGSSPDANFRHLIDWKQRINFAETHSFIDAAAVTAASGELGAAGITAPVATDPGTISTTLAAIHTYVTANYAYRPDFEGEDWSTVTQTIAKKHGDCEDLAFLAASMALAAGVPAESIRISAGDMLPRSPGEMVAAELVRLGYMTLDGTVLDTLPASQPFQSIQLTDDNYAALRNEFNNNSGGVGNIFETGWLVAETNGVPNINAPISGLQSGHMMVVYTDSNGDEFVLDPAKNRAGSMGYTTFSTDSTDPRNDMAYYRNTYNYRELITANSGPVTFTAAPAVPGMPAGPPVLNVTQGTTRFREGLTQEDLYIFQTAMGSSASGGSDHHGNPHAMEDWAGDVSGRSSIVNFLDKIDIFNVGLSDIVPDIVDRGAINAISNRVHTDSSSGQRSEYEYQVSGGRGSAVGQTLASSSPGQLGPIVADELVRDEMSALLELEYQEKDLLVDLYGMGSALLDVGAGRHIIDWPRVQELMGRIESIHFKMRLVYTSVKMKADWLFTIASRIGDQDKKEVSHFATAVFNQYFEFTNNTTGLLKQVFDQIQNVHLSNAGVRSTRTKAALNVSLTATFEVIESVLNGLSVSIYPELKVALVFWSAAKELVRSSVLYHADPFDPNHLDMYKRWDRESAKTDFLDGSPTYNKGFSFGGGSDDDYDDFGNITTEAAVEGHVTNSTLFGQSITANSFLHLYRQGAGNPASTLAGTSGSAQHMGAATSNIHSFLQARGILTGNLLNGTITANRSAIYDARMGAGMPGRYSMGDTEIMTTVGDSTFDETTGSYQNQGSQSGVLNFEPAASGYNAQMARLRVFPPLTRQTAFDTTYGTLGGGSIGTSSTIWDNLMGQGIIVGSAYVGSEFEAGTAVSGTQISGINLLSHESARIQSVLSNARNQGIAVGSTDFVYSDSNTSINEARSNAIWQALMRDGYFRGQFNTEMGTTLPAAVTALTQNAQEQSLVQQRLVQLQRGGFRELELDGNTYRPSSDTSEGFRPINALDFAVYADPENPTATEEARSRAIWDALVANDFIVADNYEVSSTANINGLTTGNGVTLSNLNHVKTILLHRDNEVGIREVLMRTPEQQMLEIGYRQDLSSTGSWLSVVQAGRMIAEGQESFDRYLKTDYFDNATKWLQKMMFKRMLIEMYISSRSQYIVSLGAKVSGASGKQTSAIASEYAMEVISQITNHYTSQLGDVQQWHELKASLNEQRFDSDKAYDTAILVSLIFAIIGAALVKFKFKGKLSSASAIQTAVGVLSILQMAVKAIVYSADSFSSNEVRGSNAATDYEESEDVEQDEERRKKSSTKGAGATFGMDYQAVNYQEQVRQKQQMKRFYASMKAMADGGKSAAEMWMGLAQALGGITSKLGMTSGLMSIIDSSKAATQRVLDNRFKVEEASVKRHNKLQDAKLKAMMTTIAVVITVVAQFSGDLFDKVGSQLNKVFGKVGLAIKNLGKKIGGTGLGKSMAKTFGKLGSGVSRGLSKLGSAFKVAGKWTSKQFGKLGEQLNKFGKWLAKNDTLKFVGEKISSVLSSVGGFMKTAGSKTGSLMKSIGTKMKSVGKKIGIRAKQVVKGLLKLVRKNPAEAVQVAIDLILTSLLDQMTDEFESEFDSNIAALNSPQAQDEDGDGDIDDNDMAFSSMGALAGSLSGASSDGGLGYSSADVAASGGNYSDLAPGFDGTLGNIDSSVSSTIGISGIEAIALAAEFGEAAAKSKSGIYKKMKERAEDIADHVKQTVKNSFDALREIAKNPDAAAHANKGAEKSIEKMNEAEKKIDAEPDPEKKQVVAANALKEVEAQTQENAARIKSMFTGVHDTNSKTSNWFVSRFKNIIDPIVGVRKRPGHQILSSTTSGDLTRHAKKIKKFRDSLSKDISTLKEVSGESGAKREKFIKLSNELNAALGGDYSPETIHDIGAKFEQLADLKLEVKDLLHSGKDKKKDREWGESPALLFIPFTRNIQGLIRGMNANEAKSFAQSIKGMAATAAYAEHKIASKGGLGANVVSGKSNVMSKITPGNEMSMGRALASEIKRAEDSSDKKRLKQNIVEDLSSDSKLSKEIAFATMKNLTSGKSDTTSAKLYSKAMKDAAGGDMNKELDLVKAFQDRASIDVERGVLNRVDISQLSSRDQAKRLMDMVGAAKKEGGHSYDMGLSLKDDRSLKQVNKLVGEVNRGSATWDADKKREMAGVMVELHVGFSGEGSQKRDIRNQLQSGMARIDAETKKDALKSALDDTVAGDPTRRDAIEGVATAVGVDVKDLGVDVAGTAGRVAAVLENNSSENIQIAADALEASTGMSSAESKALITELGNNASSADAFDNVKQLAVFENLAPNTQDSVTKIINAAMREFGSSGAATATIHKIDSSGMLVDATGKAQTQTETVGVITNASSTNGKFADFKGAHRGSTAHTIFNERFNNFSSRLQASDPNVDAADRGAIQPGDIAPDPADAQKVKEEKAAYTGGLKALKVLSEGTDIAGEFDKAITAMGGDLGAAATAVEKMLKDPNMARAFKNMLNNMAEPRDAAVIMANLMKHSAAVDPAVVDSLQTILGGLDAAPLQATMEAMEKGTNEDLATYAQNLRDVINADTDGVLSLNLGIAMKNAGAYALYNQVDKLLAASKMGTTEFGHGAGDRMFVSGSSINQEGIANAFAKMNVGSFDASSELRTIRHALAHSDLDVRSYARTLVDSGELGPYIGAPGIQNFSDSLAYTGSEDQAGVSSLKAKPLPVVEDPTAPVADADAGLAETVEDADVSIAAAAAAATTKPELASGPKAPGLNETDAAYFTSLGSPDKTRGVVPVGPKDAFTKLEAAYNNSPSETLGFLLSGSVGERVTRFDAISKLPDLDDFVTKLNDKVTNGDLRDSNPELHYKLAQALHIDPTKVGEPVEISSKYLNVSRKKTPGEALMKSKVKVKVKELYNSKKGPIASRVASYFDQGQLSNASQKDPIQTYRDKVAKSVIEGEKSSPSKNLAELDGKIEIALSFVEVALSGADYSMLNGAALGTYTPGDDSNLNTLLQDRANIKDSSGKVLSEEEIKAQYKEARKAQKKGSGTGDSQWVFVSDKSKKSVAALKDPGLGALDTDNKLQWNSAQLESKDLTAAFETQGLRDVNVPGYAEHKYTEIVRHQLRASADVSVKARLDAQTDDMVIYDLNSYASTNDSIFQSMVYDAARFKPEALDTYLSGLDKKIKTLSDPSKVDATSASDLKKASDAYNTAQEILSANFSKISKPSTEVVKMVLLADAFGKGEVAVKNKPVPAPGVPDLAARPNDISTDINSHLKTAARHNPEALLSAMVELGNVDPLTDATPEHKILAEFCENKDIQASLIMQPHIAVGLEELGDNLKGIEYIAEDDQGMTQEISLGDSLHTQLRETLMQHPEDLVDAYPFLSKGFFGGQVSGTAPADGTLAELPELFSDTSGLYESLQAASAPSVDSSGNEPTYGFLQAADPGAVLMSPDGGYVNLRSPGETLTSRDGDYGMLAPPGALLETALQDNRHWDTAEKLKVLATFMGLPKEEVRDQRPFDILVNMENHVFHLAGQSTAEATECKDLLEASIGSGAFKGSELRKLEYLDTMIDFMSGSTSAADAAAKYKDAKAEFDKFQVLDPTTPEVATAKTRFDTAAAAAAFDFSTLRLGSDKKASGVAAFAHDLNIGAFEYRGKGDVAMFGKMLESVNTQYEAELGKGRVNRSSQKIESLDILRKKIALKGLELSLQYEEDELKSSDRTMATGAQSDLLSEQIDNRRMFIDAFGLKGGFTPSVLSNEAKAAQVALKDAKDGVKAQEQIVKSETKSQGEAKLRAQEELKEAQANYEKALNECPFTVGDCKGAVKKFKEQRVRGGSGIEKTGKFGSVKNDIRMGHLSLTSQLITLSELVNKDKVQEAENKEAKYGDNGSNKMDTVANAMTNVFNNKEVRREVGQTDIHLLGNSVTLSLTPITNGFEKLYSGSMDQQERARLCKGYHDFLSVVSESPGVRQSNGFRDAMESLCKNVGSLEVGARTRFANTPFSDVFTAVVKGLSIEAKQSIINEQRQQTITNTTFGDAAGGRRLGTSVDVVKDANAQRGLCLTEVQDRSRAEAFANEKNGIGATISRRTDQLLSEVGSGNDRLTETEMPSIMARLRATQESLSDISVRHSIDVSAAQKQISEATLKIVSDPNITWQPRTPQDFENLSIVIGHSTDIDPGLISATADKMSGTAINRLTTGIRNMEGADQLNLASQLDVDASKARDKQVNLTTRAERMAVRQEVRAFRGQSDEDTTLRQIADKLNIFEPGLVMGGYFNNLTFLSPEDLYIQLKEDYPARISSVEKYFIKDARGNVTGLVKIQKETKTSGLSTWFYGGAKLRSEKLAAALEGKSPQEKTAFMKELFTQDAKVFSKLMKEQKEGLAKDKPIQDGSIRDTAENLKAAAESAAKLASYPSDHAALVTAQATAETNLAAAVYVAQADLKKLSVLDPTSFDRDLALINAYTAAKTGPANSGLDDARAALSKIGGAVADAVAELDAATNKLSELTTQAVTDATQADEFAAAAKEFADNTLRDVIDKATRAAVDTAIDTSGELEEKAKGTLRSEYYNKVDIDVTAAANAVKDLDPAADFFAKTKALSIAATKVETVARKALSDAKDRAKGSAEAAAANPKDQGVQKQAKADAAVVDVAQKKLDKASDSASKAQLAADFAVVAAQANDAAGKAKIALQKINDPTSVAAAAADAAVNAFEKAHETAEAKFEAFQAEVYKDAPLSPSDFNMIFEDMATDETFSKKMAECFLTGSSNFWPKWTARQGHLLPHSGIKRGFGLKSAGSVRDNMVSLFKDSWAKGAENPQDPSYRAMTSVMAHVLESGDPNKEMDYLIRSHGQSVVKYDNAMAEHVTGIDTLISEQHPIMKDPRFSSYFDGILLARAAKGDEMPVTPGTTSAGLERVKEKFGYVAGDMLNSMDAQVKTTHSALNECVKPLTWDDKRPIPTNLSVRALFTDANCTHFKPGITKVDIEEARNSFELAAHTDPSGAIDAVAIENLMGDIDLHYDDTIGAAMKNPETFFANPANFETGTDAAQSFAKEAVENMVSHTHYMLTTGYSNIDRSNRKKFMVQVRADMMRYLASEHPSMFFGALEKMESKEDRCKFLAYFTSHVLDRGTTKYAPGGTKLKTSSLKEFIFSQEGKPAKKGRELKQQLMNSILQSPESQISLEDKKDYISALLVDSDFLVKEPGGSRNKAEKRFNEHCKVLHDFCCDYFIEEGRVGQDGELSDDGIKMADKLYTDILKRLNDRLGSRIFSRLFSFSNTGSGKAGAHELMKKDHQTALNTLVTGINEAKIPTELKGLFVQRSDSSGQPIHVPNPDSLPEERAKAIAAVKEAPNELKEYLVKYDAILQEVETNPYGFFKEDAEQYQEQIQQDARDAVTAPVVSSTKVLRSDSIIQTSILDASDQNSLVKAQESFARTHSPHHIGIRDRGLVALMGTHKAEFQQFVQDVKDEKEDVRLDSGRFQIVRGRTALTDFSQSLISYFGKQELTFDTEDSDSFDRLLDRREALSN